MYKSKLSMTEKQDVRKSTRNPRKRKRLKIVIHCVETLKWVCW